MRRRILLNKGIAMPALVQPGIAGSNGRISLEALRLNMHRAVSFGAGAESWMARNPGWRRARCGPTATTDGWCVAMASHGNLRPCRECQRYDRLREVVLISGTAGDEDGGQRQRPAATATIMPARPARPLPNHPGPARAHLRQSRPRRGLALLRRRTDRSVGWYKRHRR